MANVPYPSSEHVMDALKHALNLAHHYASGGYADGGAPPSPPTLPPSAGPAMMGQGGQGAPQDMSQFAGNGMMGQRAPAEARLPPGYGPGEGSMPGMMGQGGQGAPQDMSQFPQVGAGKGAVNPGAPGNYPPPPGYGPGQGAMPGMMGQRAPQNMSQFLQGGAGKGMMGQQAPQNIPQFLQQNYPAMGAFPQLGTQAGAQGNIPIQAGARAPVAFGSPNPMGAPMLSELVKAPPPPPAPEPDYNNYND